MADNPYARYANPYAGMVPVGAPDPMKPLELRGKQIGVRKGEADLAKTPYEIRKEAADAAKAELDLKNAREQYAAQHPSVQTSGLFGPDYLKTLSQSDQNMVKALSEGRLAFPQGAALRAPFWQEKLSQVAQFDPTFDATNFNARAKGRASAISGKLGQSNNALNTAIGHLSTLQGQISGTASHSFTPYNAVSNTISKTFGDAGVTNFQDTASKLADELEAVYRNGGGAEAGVTRQLRNLDVNASQAQKEGVINNAMDLLASKMAANLSQYNFGTGGKPTWDMLDQHTLQVLNSPGFTDIRDKYFAAPAGMTPPPPTNSDGAPPVYPQGGGGTPPNVPHADYSGMVGGPQQNVATQQYRTAHDPVGAAALSAMIKHGAPYDMAAAYAQSHGFNPPPPDAYAAAVAFQKQHPNAAPNVQADRMVPTTLGERLSASPAATFLAGAGSGATAGLGDVVARTISNVTNGPGQYDANRAAMAATNPGSDLAGNIVGSVGGMFGGGKLVSGLLASGAKGGVGRNALALALKNPVKAGALGDAAYGTTYGASESPDNPLAGAGIGLLTSPIASLAGQTVSRGLGAGMQGVVNPAVQRLKDAGIPLTVGEVLGGGAKKAQDAMTSVFGPGNMVARRYAEGRQALNQVGYNMAGDVVNTPINAVGQKGINLLNDAKSKAFSNALDPVSLDLNTPQFQARRATLDAAAQAIPDVKDAQGLATSGLQTYLDGPASGGVMSGRDFQEGYRGLSRLGSQPDTQPYGYEIGNVMRGGKIALAEALQSQNPGAFEGFQQANQAHRMLSILAKAHNAAKNQIGDGGEALWTPAQLGNASTQNAIKYGSPIAAAGGNRPFNQLINDSQQVMSSKLPESGTFPRQLMGAALTGGIAAPGGMFGARQDGVQGAAEGAAIPLGLLTLLGTRWGQKALTASLLNRPQTARRIGNYFVTNPQLGGDVATSGALQFLPQP